MSNSASIASSNPSVSDVNGKVELDQTVLRAILTALEGCYGHTTRDGVNRAKAIQLLRKTLPGSAPISVARPRSNSEHDSYAMPTGVAIRYRFTRDLQWQYTENRIQATPPCEIQELHPGEDVVTVQQAWIWAGGNPNIKATKADLKLALQVLDEICDESDSSGQTGAEAPDTSDQDTTPSRDAPRATA